MEATSAKKSNIDFTNRDPYFLHYLLVLFLLVQLVQNIKIEEDEEGVYGILDIDMKPYFNDLKKARISFGEWGQWIR